MLKAGQRATAPLVFYPAMARLAEKKLDGRAGPPTSHSAGAAPYSRSSTDNA